MYQITKAKKLADKIYLMDVVAPRVAANCLPGQFIIAKVDKEGERIPLTICDYDREKGTITIVFQIVGASTEKMSKLVEGDSFTDFVGPLGVASEFTKEDPEALKNKKFLFVAGGVGAAPVYPQVKWLHEHGIQADVIVGAKTGQRLDKLFELIDMIIENQSMRIATGVLNEILAEAVAMQQPPSDKGRRLKIFYMTQISVKPPTFVVFVNDKKLMHYSYTRYIENQIRNAFGFRGTPLRFIIRERKEDK